MATLRDIRNKIRAVENIRKITKAMQLVAAAKLNRAQSRAHAVRPFAEELDRLLGGLAVAESKSWRMRRSRSLSSKEKRRSRPRWDACFHSMK
jgi:ATP synthase F1 gamma subunit